MREFPANYKVLNKQEFCLEGFRIIPIRYEDRIPIMKWRNEQIYHLRQQVFLTKEVQDDYFDNVVSKLFYEGKPGQILFSYLKGNECVGYGGLVHINWKDRNAEISFIINTALEEIEFEKHWGIYLSLLEEVAFEELKLHKIYTYAFDLRPHLYKAIEAAGFEKEAVLKEHFLFEGKYRDVVFHTKINRNISLRKAAKEDAQITYQWANDPKTRANSFNQSTINWEEHNSWWQNKVNHKNAFYYIVEEGAQPIGIVRFDKRTDDYVIGITVAPEGRGRGIAKKLLTLACEEFFKHISAPVTAMIKESNIVSQKVFESVGFIKTGSKKIGESASFIYQKTK